MSDTAAIWFVFRSPDEGPAGKRVRRLAAPSVLAWFQARVEEARVSATPGETGAAEIGGAVPGLAAVFEATHRLSLHTPKTPAALRKLLTEQMGLPGGEDAIRVDVRSVRVLTGAGGAYFFFDEDSVTRFPEHVAPLVGDGPAAALPEGVWDPFVVPRAAKDPKAPKEPKAPKAPKDPKAPKSKQAKLTASAAAAAHKHEQAYKAALGGRDEAAARAYVPADRFQEGEVIRHAKFGTGVVTRSEGGKIEAIFSDVPRILVQGR